ncbi:LacI family DNA-binding transcriptional regulator [Streptomyces sp. NPDC056004]|uniref:LacI family DNA-binding transcriptional regulator n=1 Tax=Streptomyces sp. NPDC056004 TaxID=3345677 RepID=UPI0035D8FC02
MSDVARHAGVSRTTVSFVLNERADAGIPEETRLRIRASTEELGYRPNAGARALAARRSEWYGLITEIVTAPFAVDVIKGAQDRAWADGKFLLITAGDRHRAMETAAFDKLPEQRADRWCRIGAAACLARHGRRICPQPRSEHADGQTLPQGGGRTTVVAEAPLLIRPGLGLALRILARGGRIEAFVDGLPLVDVTDTHHTRGRIGLNVFGGRAAYQDTFVTAL